MLSLHGQKDDLVLLKLLYLLRDVPGLSVLPSHALHAVPPADCILSGKAVQVSWLLFAPLLPCC